MFVNGASLDDKRFLRISEYVQHEDVFVPTQTLLQALEYHANLRLGPSVSYAEKRKRERSFGRFIKSVTKPKKGL